MWSRNKNGFIGVWSSLEILNEYFGAAKMKFWLMEDGILAMKLLCW